MTYALFVLMKRSICSASKRFFSFVSNPLSLHSLVAVIKICDFARSISGYCSGSSAEASYPLPDLFVSSPVWIHVDSRLEETAHYRLVDGHDLRRQVPKKRKQRAT